MHIRIPEAVYRYSDITITVPKSGPVPDRQGRDRFNAVLAESLSGQTAEYEDDTYWYNTHKLPMNDVVHSKRVVDGEYCPNVRLNNGRILVSHYLSTQNCSYENWSSEELRFDSYDDFHNVLIVNDGNVSMKILLTVPALRPNTTRQQCFLQVDAVYASPYESGGIVRVRQYYRTWRYTMICDSTTVSYDDITGRYILAPVITAANWASNNHQYFPDEFENYIRTVISGYTHNYWNSANHNCPSPAFGSLMESSMFYVESVIYNVLAESRRHNWNTWSYRTKSWEDTIGVDPFKPIPPYERFVLHEDERIAGKLDPVLVGSHDKGLSNYWWNVLVQNAYLDALDSVPRLNDNSISNLIEIAGFVKSLLVDHKVEIPKSLGDAWLSYRYVYTTSKLDAEEAISFVHRHCELGTLDQWIHCFGRSHSSLSMGGFDVSITCRCGLEIRPRDVAILGKIWRALYTYGLQPNFYVVWDMIPYSFIIDWLIPIGNIAKVWDAERAYSGTYYEIKDIVFSISYDIQDEYHNVFHQYTRWVSGGLQQLSGYYSLEEDPSGKVIGMRVLDTLSLFIGKGKK